MDISSTGMDSNSFCVKTASGNRDSIHAGLAFGHDWDDHVRFSLAVPMATLERAVGLMKEFADKIF